LKSKVDIAKKEVEKLKPVPAESVVIKENEKLRKKSTRVEKVKDVYGKAIGKAKGIADYAPQWMKNIAGRVWGLPRQMFIEMPKKTWNTERKSLWNAMDYLDPTNDKFWMKPRSAAKKDDK